MFLQPQHSCAGRLSSPRRRHARSAARLAATALGVFAALALQLHCCQLEAAGLQPAAGQTTGQDERAALPPCHQPDATSASEHGATSDTPAPASSPTPTDRDCCPNCDGMPAIASLADAGPAVQGAVERRAPDSEPVGLELSAACSAFIAGPVGLFLSRSAPADQRLSALAASAPRFLLHQRFRN